MPSITITLTTAQVRQVQEALKEPEGELPTVADIVAWCRRQLTARVLTNELKNTQAAADRKRRDELALEGWN